MDCLIDLAAPLVVFGLREEGGENTLTGEVPKRDKPTSLLFKLSLGELSTPNCLADRTNRISDPVDRDIAERGETNFDFWIVERTYHQLLNTWRLEPAEAVQDRFSNVGLGAIVRSADAGEGERVANSREGLQRIADQAWARAVEQGDENFRLPTGEEQEGVDDDEPGFRRLYLVQEEQKLRHVFWLLERDEGEEFSLEALMPAGV